MTLIYILRAITLNYLIDLFGVFISFGSTTPRLSTLQCKALKKLIKQKHHSNFLEDSSHSQYLQDINDL